MMYHLHMHVSNSLEQSLVSVNTADRSNTP